MSVGGLSCVRLPIKPSLFADVLTKPADLAIGDHRAPQSGQCKPGFSNAILVFDFPVHYDVLYFRRISDYYY